MKRHVFIVGSKGIPAKYGGYETFVECLTGKRQDQEIEYHVACKVNKKSSGAERFEYNGADCFNVYVPNIGPAQAIYYDVRALKDSINYVKKYRIKNPIFYILACRIGPFMSSLVKQIHNLGGKVYVNPDGHEWMRAKWSLPVRKYWKYSEKLMVKNSDMLICDSRSIEDYIHKSYKNYSPETTFIAYGADIHNSKLTDTDEGLRNWFNQYKIKPNQYFLVVGRFVPENNYETMIREFMHSSSLRDLVIITNVEKNAFYNKLKESTHFDSDKRIKFVGTVYDAELLKKIRELAFAYIHGHSVGGTNPSLLEALASTKLNLLYDVGFNREVARDSALYWTKEKNNLKNLIEKSEVLTDAQVRELAEASTYEVRNRYSWEKIVKSYEQEFKGAVFDG